MYNSTLLLTWVLDVGGWSTPHPGRFTTGTDLVSFVWEAGGPQGRSGLVLKILPPLGFDPQTFQPIASRYTNYVIPKD